MAKSASRSFEAVLERGASALNWTVVHIPFDAAELWGKRGQIRVKGEINGFAFRTSLFPDGTGRHTLLVNKTMQARGRVSVGMTARFRLEPDTEKRVPALPVELERALAEEPGLRRWFDHMSASNRNEIGKWVAGVKSAEARKRRADQCAERFFETMEAERELPPMIRAAFACDAVAYEGWKRMSPGRRRGHLLGIFYYRDPKSRQRRLAKAIQDAYALGAKDRIASKDPL